tara:strand:+ start:426435 stop:426626 length:192 start_codon:yes stop_codon:yes gene_type:complete
MISKILLIIFYPIATQLALRSQQDPIAEINCKHPRPACSHTICLILPTQTILSIINPNNFHPV